MNRILGWAFVISMMAALAYFILAATNPRLANDIVNLFTK